MESIRGPRRQGTDPGLIAAPDAQGARNTSPGSIDRLGVSSFASRLLLTVILVAGLLTHGAVGWGARRFAAGTVALYDDAAATASRCGPILAFASDTPSRPTDVSERTFEALYWFNVMRFGGPVIAMRNLGPLDSLATSVTPGRPILIAPGPPEAGLGSGGPLPQVARECLHQPGAP